MIRYKTDAEIEVMKKSCRLAAAVLVYIEPFVKVGASCLELNDLCHKFIVDRGAIPSPLNYKGFPKSICTSVNDVVCHGIPNETRLREGDIINLDITTLLDSYHGDTSRTFLVGKCARAARDLVKTTEEALWLGIKAVRPGGFTGDIGAVIQKFIESRGYSVVREYCGHGIGKVFHEDPHVPHFGVAGEGAAIKPGMVFTIEPMVNLGKQEVELLEDTWTVVTKDSKLSAQFEHTIAVYKDRVEVLTVPPDANFDPVVWRA